MKEQQRGIFGNQPVNLDKGTRFKRGEKGWGSETGNKKVNSIFFMNSNRCFSPKVVVFSSPPIPLFLSGILFWVTLGRSE